MGKKIFEGVWVGHGKVYYTTLYPNMENKIDEVREHIQLEIKKITDQIYFISIIRDIPLKNIIFNCVCTQSTENKLLLQSSTSGLNNFYFIKEECGEILHVNWTTPNINNVCQSAVIEFYRI